MANTSERERRPWWQLYAIAMLLPLLLGLVQFSSGPPALLAALRLASVVGVFALLGRWMHAHPPLPARPRGGDAPWTEDEALDVLTDAEEILAAPASAARHLPID